MLTLPDIAIRLRVPFNERSIKRLIRRHKVAHLRVAGEWRLTEEQFLELREALTCSPSGGGSQAGRSTSAARYVSARRSERSKSTLLDAVSEHLRKPTSPSSTAKSETRSFTALRVVHGG